MKNDPINVYLISGFLGSGKTTFLKRLLNNMSGVKVGVIVNEFGIIGIDGTLIQKNDIKMIEISNGSIFCACLKKDFVKTLVSFTEEDVDVLVIENSGMADPSNFQSLLASIDNKLSRPYNYCGSICIVDAISFLKQSEVLVSVKKQILCSNIIIINKVDAVGHETIVEIKDRIRSINPETCIYEAIYADIPIDTVFSNVKFNGYTGESCNTISTRPPSCALECFFDIPIEEVKSFLKEVEADTYRIKGFVKSPEGWYEVESVNGLTAVGPYKPCRHSPLENTKLVFIGSSSRLTSTMIKDAWYRNMDKKIMVYE